MRSIKEILNLKKLITVKVGSKIYDIVCLMAQNNIGLVPVLTEDGKLIGVFSERDLVKRFGSSHNYCRQCNDCRSFACRYKRIP